MTATACMVGVPWQKRMGKMFRGNASNILALDLFTPDQIWDKRKYVLGIVATNPTAWSIGLKIVLEVQKLHPRSLDEIT